jgi:ribose/xylose/arabinose/galactoside ABC-type transport system permease subunit
MAYDDSRFRGESGFRSEPDYRTEDDVADTPAYGGASTYAPGSYSYSEHGERTDAVSPRRGYGPANLDDVFDDPSHGEVGRDRIAIHLIWELILLVGVLGVGFLLYRDHRSTVTGDGLRNLMLSATVIGLLVLGIGLSLRAAVPNLAVGPIALASALFFAEHAKSGLLITAVQAGLVGLAIGAVVAVVVVGLHVPAWATSLGAGLAVVVWIQQNHTAHRLPAGSYEPLHQAAYWYGGFAVLAFAGGVLGSVKSIRRAVGRFRPVADPADRRGGVAGTVSAAALLGSSALAAVAGVLIALQSRQVGPADTSLTLTGLALGGALLGGTSAFGRRGGLLGAVLAATLLAVVIRYLDVTDRRVSQLAIAAVAIGVGLVVTRLVESFGRPPTPVDREVDRWRTISPGSTPTTLSMSASDNGGWGNSRTTGWTSPLPASSAEDRWGNDDEWTGR